MVSGGVVCLQTNYIQCWKYEILRPFKHIIIHLTEKLFPRYTKNYLAVRNAMVYVPHCSRETLKITPFSINQVLLFEIIIFINQLE